MSKEKREKQKKARERAARREKNLKFLAIVGVVLIALALIGGIGGTYYYNNVYLTRAVDDYSAGLTEDGLIADIKALDYVELCDYKDVSVDADKVTVSEEEWESYISPILAQYGTMSEQAGQVIAEGDVINVDYVGSIDGIEFEGGSTQGNGTTICVGSAGYIDGFEDQLVGHKTGENFDINVTFPEDYGKEELNGKAAVFNITINSKSKPSEYNDEFVANYLGDGISAYTAESYKLEYMQNQLVENFDEYIKNYIMSGSAVTVPEDYLNLVKGTIKSQDIANFNATNDYYEQYLGDKPYKKFSDFTGMDTKEYEASLSNKGRTQVTEDLVYQAIFEDAGLELTDEHIDAALSDFGVERQYYSNFVQVYGEGYMHKLALKHCVDDYLKTCFKITGLTPSTQSSKIVQE